jgi:LPS-assembly lipoprotein
MNRRTFLLSGTALALAGCSFRPLYGTSPAGTDVSGELQSIQIADINNRPGQLVRNQLLSVMSPGSGDAKYTLRLTVASRDISVSSLPGSVTTRSRLQLSGNYVLTDNATGERVNSGNSFSTVGYDQVRQPVADLQAKREATERAAIELAQDIRTRIAAYFATRQTQ